MELTMLGTGHAAVKKCYNTCFALKRDEGFFLVDAGGGNGILSRLDSAGLELKNLRGMFVTHAHTDHITGAVWIIRMMQSVVKSEEYAGPFRIWCNDEVKRVLTFMCDNMLANGHFDFAGDRIRLVEVRDGESFECMGMDFTAFDIFSTKKKQFGFCVKAEGKNVACLGDEPYNPRCEKYVRGADLLMCEAFCLSRDEERFHAHEKHHGTALEAAGLAQALGAKSLLLYHTEETDLKNRKENYTREAAAAFDGPIFVPDDLESLPL
ncbi:MAG: MBL fold metallo-hydrolase [Oscillospiraceae bacterium]